MVAVYILDPYKRETETRVMYNGPEGLAEGGRGL
jgi:hypothetical protein